MEGLTRLVTESLARHGFDRPVDYRRLHWSRWFRCESHHSLLLVPSKPGVFALAEEIIDFGTSDVETLSSEHPEGERPKPERRRMLAVTQFFDDDDMAFVLDRMLSRHNPMRARLVSGRFFVRFVVIEEQSQRRSICNALNQWIASSAEKASGIGAHFASSLELTPATEYIPEANDAQGLLFGDARVPDSPTTVITATGHAVQNVARVPSPATAGSDTNSIGEARTKPTPLATASQLDSGAATNIHCPSPFPSGF
jgi:hypothetical protein